MALTEFQRVICRLIANQRLKSGESYVAGAAALNTLILNTDSTLFTGEVEQLRVSLTRGMVQFHEGRIYGALPQPQEQ